eukprot:GHUV01025058.1.p2 GENE.GHUV01025058.1~~GHUV01025058.1.p2  ORF type:complete len:105 (+),score=12.96 GHUV01025058.1:226-540(+)
MLLFRRQLQHSLFRSHKLLGCSHTGCIGSHNQVAAQSACISATAAPRSRAYPDEPRVGVGVIVFKQPTTQPQQTAEVLLIRRAKEPAKGQWCFPGGSLELGHQW